MLEIFNYHGMFICLRRFKPQIMADNMSEAPPVLLGNHVDILDSPIRYQIKKKKKLHLNS